jgi:hypothetical protein
VTTHGLKPITPGFGTKENSVFASKTFMTFKRILALPCDNPPSLWIETAAKAALKAYIGQLGGDPKELYHTVFHESVIGTNKNSFREAFPHISPDESKLTRFFFDFAPALDLTLWFYFLAGVLEDGVLDWLGQVEQQTACTDISQRAGSGDDPFGGSFSGGRWGTFDFNFNPGRYFPAGPPALVLQPGESGTIACMCNYQDTGSVPVQGRARILFDDGAYVLDEDISEQKSGGQYRPTVVWAHASNGKHSGRTKNMEWQCTTDQNLPHGELFPAGGHCFINQTFV